MGQQQLLLVILVTIIVGIATVVAINVFGTSAASANEDAVRNDVLTIASSAQGWYIKPTMMGGGGNSFGGDGNDMTFNDFNFSASWIDDTDGLTAVNMNGTYILSGHSDTEVTVRAYPSSHEDYNGTEESATDAGDYMEATVTKGGIEWEAGGYDDGEASE